MTRDEAIDVLAQCALIRMSVAELEEKARTALKTPHLRAVDDTGSRIGPALRDKNTGRAPRDSE